MELNFVRASCGTTSERARSGAWESLYRSSPLRELGVRGRRLRAILAPKCDRRARQNGYSGAPLGGGDIRGRCALGAGQLGRKWQGGEGAPIGHARAFDWRQRFAICNLQFASCADRKWQQPVPWRCCFVTRVCVPAVS